MTEIKGCIMLIFSLHLHPLKFGKLMIVGLSNNLMSILLHSLGEITFIYCKSPFQCATAIPLIHEH